MTDDRRERYAAAIEGVSLWRAADAVMAVADAEHSQRDELLADQATTLAALFAEIARLHTELAATIKAKQENDERFQLAAAEARITLDRVRKVLNSDPGWSRSELERRLRKALDDD